MVLKPIYDPRVNMTGYYPSGPPPGYSHGEPGQQLDANQGQGYPPSRGSSPYPSQHSPLNSPGQQYGAPQDSPRPPPPSSYGSGYYPPQQPQYAGSPAPAGQYPPTGYGYSGHQGQQSYNNSSYHSSPYPAASPYERPSKPQYVQPPQQDAASPGYPPQIKQEYNAAQVPGQVPQTAEDRGLLGALAGGAAGGFAGQYLRRMSHTNPTNIIKVTR